jgi:aminoglycoside 6'-N-acetyltransferase I
MRVRPVEPRDRDDWLRMRAALWPDEPAADHARQCDAFLRGGPAEASFLSAALVSEAEPGRLDGFVELFVRNYAEGCEGPTPHVEGWYVEPRSRGRGVGRALMRAAEAWAREKGFTEIASDTQLWNEASQRAHGALGFREVERVVHFRKALEP